MEPPRFEDRKSFLVAGMTERYNVQKLEGVPAQWQRFAPYIGKVPGEVGQMAYGICFNMDTAGNMDYMCAVEVSGQSRLPAELSTLEIGSRHYAVFSHRTHISEIGKTWQAIFSDWLPASGYKTVPAPQFETYSPQFDPRTGNGGAEIWIPIAPLPGNGVI